MFFVCADGNCSIEPGPGGYAAIIKGNINGTFKHHTVSGFEHNTTVKRMELKAVVEGLEQVDRSTEVIVITSSTYVVQGATVRTHTSNIDLWKRLNKESKKHHHIEWQQITDYKDHPDNVKVNKLALDEVANAISELPKGVYDEI